ncbi:MAG: hypothetical protein QXJ15_00655 [Candidatus Bathyarchaeia archaeon]
MHLIALYFMEALEGILSEAQRRGELIGYESWTEDLTDEEAEARFEVQIEEDD